MGWISGWHYPSFPVVATFGGAFALIAGGIALIVFAARAKREFLARRISLVLPYALARAPAIGSRVAARRSATLVRESQTGPFVPERRAIERLMAVAGIASRSALAAFAALRWVAGLAAAIVAWIGIRTVAPHAAGGVQILVVAVGAFLGWYLPMAGIRRTVKSTAAAVAAGLPEALELLVVCVEAGLSLEDAIDRTVVELRRTQPALAEEFALTSADLKILPSRDQALLNLAARVDLPSIRSVVTTLSQTMRYGTPLVQAMRSTAAEMRNEFLLHLEEKANALPVLLTVPMMLFIMPTIFLIVGGPAALRLIDNFLH